MMGSMDELRSPSLPTRPAAPVIVFPSPSMLSVLQLLGTIRCPKKPRAAHTDAQGPIIEASLCVPRQCDAAPPRYQRASSSVALDRDLKPDAWAPVGLKLSAVAAIDPGDAGAQLQRQRPG